MSNKRKRFFILATEDEPGFPTLNGVEMWSDLASAVKEAREMVADSEQGADCFVVCEIVPVRRVTRVVRVTAVSQKATEFCLPADDGDEASEIES